MKQRPRKSTDAHVALITDASADPMDRGWAVHLVGYDDLRHLEPDIAPLVEHENPYLRSYALETLLRWGRVEYLDLAIHRAITPDEWDEVRDIVLSGLGDYASAYQERRHDALTALVSVAENDETLLRVVNAYRNALRAVGDPRWISADDFDRDDVDWAPLEPYRGRTSAPQKH